MGALQTLFAHAVRMQAVTLALSLAAVLLCTSASPLKTEAHFNTDVFTADNTHVTQNSVETAEPAAPKFDTSVFSAAEWTEDAAPVETIPLRRYSSGSGTASGVAPSPPAPTPPAKKFTQPITVPLTAAQYTGVQKTVYERGYGVALGIFNTTTKQYEQGCSVSSAVKSRRAVKVEFTARVAGEYSANAEAQTTAIQNNPATLAQAVSDAKTAGGATFANVTVPMPDGSDLTVEAAKVEVISSGASSIAASGCLAVGLAILALRH